MKGTQIKVPCRYDGIAQAEADRLLLQGFDVVECSGHELTPTKIRVSVGEIAIEGDHRLVFEDRFLVPQLRTQRDHADGRAQRRVSDLATPPNQRHPYMWLYLRKSRLR
jgi:hypothetical protein